MPWIILLIAGFCEIGWAIGLKLIGIPTYGHKTTAGILTGIFFFLSFGGLAYSIRIIPLGTAYAVWTGVGAIGVAILGISLFNESVSFMRLFFITCIVAGIIGLKLSCK